jgi:hypothetical protein
MIKLVLVKILKVALTKLVTEKVLVAVFVHVAGYLVKKTDNTLDDKLVSEIKMAFSIDD